MSRTTQLSFMTQAAALSIGATLLASSVIGCGSPMRNVTTPASTPAAPAIAASGAVPPGTQIPVRVVQSLSSRDTESTELVTERQQGFVVAADVRGMAGVVWISGGTPVVATVTRKVHERLGREGKLIIRFESTTAANGATVRLSDRPHRFTGRKRLAGVIVGSILLFPIGLLFLLLQGGDVTLEGGSGLTATVVE